MVQILVAERGLMVDKGGPPKYFGGKLTGQEGCGMKFNCIVFVNGYQFVRRLSMATTQAGREVQPVEMQPAEMQQANVQPALHPRSVMNLK
jgi:hypothetical protein